jgi:predicted DNA-binding transcriptional regulator YafY
MPISKNQWLRLQVMLGMLRRGLYINYNTFMEEMLSDPNFYISPRTFSRDIQTLKDIGAPIEYSAKNRGYYLLDPSWTNEDVPTVPGDVKLLLLSEKVSRTFMPPQLRSELSNAVNALLMKQESGMPEGMDLENFQIINPEFVPQVDPEVFLEVYQAWENKHYLKITYSSSKGHDSVKLIQPHLLAWNSGIWYIKGLVAAEDGVPCEPPFKLRVFALHRIGNAEKKAGHFTLEPEDEKRIRQSGLFTFEKLDEIEIEFFQPYVKPMQERFFSSPESIIAQTEESVTIRLKNVPEHAALQLIFRALGNVRVIKPASLQESLRKVAHTILERMEQ